MKIFKYISPVIIVIVMSNYGFAQLDSVWHQGPATGTLASGVMVILNPNTFHPESNQDPRVVDMNLSEPDFGPMILDIDESVLPEYNYTEDLNASDNPSGGNGQTVLLNKFPSITMTNSIPPDPHLAVGPDHIIACVNSSFAVYDKEGNRLASVDADSWISPVITSGAFDPQIMYDHYAGRWFMLWDWQNSTTLQAYFIISYTDDSDPFGTWYTYLMDANVNGTVNSNTWGDFPQIGYDEQAIFINSRSFTFAGAYLYNRIRILNKSQFYASNGGQVNWIDIWNIRTPAQGPGGQALDVIHPVYSYTPGSGSYFYWASRSGANFYCVYQILNPLSTSPRLRGKVIPTQTYGQTPNANQLGGGSPLIEANGSHVKTQPVLRDGKIFFTHSISNSTNASYASIKYGIYDIASQTITEQAEQGAIGYFYLYPAIAVDQDLNIAITYSRSANTEYIGAYYSTKQATAPAGLEPSQLLQEGLGNYVVTFGGTRNRWGDYLGICVDPTDFYSVFMLSEYAMATNQWATYIGEIRMAPYSGAHAFFSPIPLVFGDIEVGTTSQAGTITIANYGSDDLVINNIPSTAGDFNLETSITFPYTLSSYDSLILEFTYSPQTAGFVSVDFAITSNDPNFTAITVTGNGYRIYPALDKTFYASSGAQNNGNILTIDGLTGAGTTIGQSLFNGIKSLAINSATGTMYGLVVGTSSSEIVRVNAGGGDSYNLFNLGITQPVAIAFDTAGVFYAITLSGDVYTVDLSNGSDSLIVNAVGSYSGITFHPVTNELWATSRALVPPNRDAVFKVDLITGDTTIVGHTGLGKLTNALVFDENGNLFGLIGTESELNDFVSINPANGVGTIIGSVGFNHILGLAYAETGVTSVEGENEGEIIPAEYVLKQNYPNPFNPTTKIEFSLPVVSEVKLTIYNLLGQEMVRLIEGERNAGTHSVQWNASDANGTKLSSGIYFYELRAAGTNGNNFQQIKKMILLK